jgi:hypothetical protein
MLNEEAFQAVLRAAGEIGTSDRFDLDEGDLHIIF